MTPRVSVLVPSYGRPESLARCLAALGAQTRAPDEVVAGVRVGDDATVAVAEAARAAGLPVRIARTAATGVVASMQAALDAATGDIIALTDDDARPFPAWIAGLLAHFQSAPDVGGVGGRDWQPWERGNARRVGVVQWFGRVIGNHHLGAGPARDVDVLKGVNCSFRAPLLRTVGFDGRLRGTGAQLYWELGVCLPMRRAGWRLIYDPSVAVDHDVAPRLDADHLHRGVFAEPPLVDAVHNETVALLEGRHGAARASFLAWAFLVGTGEAPGPVQCARRLLQGDSLAIRRWRATVAGRLAGASTVRRSPRRLAVPTPPSR
ncbi:MAG: glycosyl transferase family A [Gemmatimonas sp.]|nr:glycosyl transferase family A [Gemmatimonas sp.]